jgi:ubiquinone biosynthesis protein
MARRPDATARESLRLAQVYHTVMRYLLDMAVDHGPLAGVRRRVQYWLHDVPQRPVALGTATKARLLLQELGPTYVKVGQLVSSQSQVLPDDWERELTRLQQNVAPFPYEDVRRIVMEELGAPPEELYERFDEVPLAAASLGQVHRARVDGDEVVVKVRRPGAARRVRADLGIMRNLTRFLERQAGWAREVGLASVVDEFGKNVLGELDYYGEAYNARRLAANMLDVPGVTVPRIYPEHSSARVLTMQYVEGVKITSVGRFRAAGLDLDALSQHFLEATVKQLLIDGFFHGDPHPGNVLVDTETSTVSMIDLGMCGQLTLQQRFTLIQLVVVARRQDVTAMAQVMRGLSTPFRKLDEIAYRRDFERRVGRFLDPDSRAPMVDAMSVGFDVLRDNGLRLDPAFTLAVKAMMQAEVIATTLQPAGGILSRGYEIAEQMLKEQLTTERLSTAGGERAESIMLELVRRGQSVPGLAQRWLDQEEPLRPARQEAAQFDDRVTAGQASWSQAVTSVVLAGVLVGTGIVATGSMRPQWTWIRDLASLGFVGALLGSVIFVFSVLRRLRRHPDDR